MHTSTYLIGFCIGLHPAPAPIVFMPKALMWTVMARQSVSDVKVGSRGGLNGKGDGGLTSRVEAAQMLKNLMENQDVNT